MYLLTCTYLFSFILMFIAGLILNPAIRKLSSAFGYYALPNGRSSHSQAIPNIGGLSFYLIFLFALSIWPITESSTYSEVRILLSPAFLLVLGLMDDKEIIPVKIKALAQILAIILFIQYSDIRLTVIYGIGELTPEAGFYFTLLLIFVVLNAINLVDGIDGLLGMIAVVSLLIAAFIFYTFGHYFESILLIGLSGMIISFLIFNLRKKIIMGDTGSMLIGFILGFAVVKLYQLNAENQHSYNAFISQIAVFSLIAYPIMDMIRVFFVRVINKTSPFKADRNHFHHILLDHFLASHLQASLLILTIHTSLIILAFLLMPYLSIWGYISFYLICLLVFCLGVYLIRLNVPFRADSVKQKAHPA